MSSTLQKWVVLPHHKPALENKWAGPPETWSSPPPFPPGMLIREGYPSGNGCFHDWTSEEQRQYYQTKDPGYYGEYHTPEEREMMEQARAEQRAEEGLKTVAVIGALVFFCFVLSTFLK